MNTPFTHFFRVTNLQHDPLLQDDELRQALQTMWDFEGSGPYQEVTNEPDHEWGDEWNGEGEPEWEWEGVKEEPDDSYDDGVMEPEPHEPWDDNNNPQNLWHAKSQPYEAWHATSPPLSPPPPPPPVAPQGSQEKWVGWHEWKGWNEWGDGNPKKWEHHTNAWKSNRNKNWKSWKNTKAPWSSQKKAKPDGNYPKGGGFTDHDGTWWPILD